MKINRRVLKQQFIPIILGASINGYGVVRSFFEKGIRTIVIDSTKGPAFYSRFAQGIQCNDCNKDDTSLLCILEEVSEQFKSANCKGILFPTSDTYLFFVGRNEGHLRDLFFIAMSSWKSVQDCTNKTLMYKKAEQLGVPYPKTFYCNTTRDVRSLIERLPFPLLLKPEVTIGFTEKLGLGKKAVIVESGDDLLTLLDRMDNNDLSDTNMIVQEVIGGGTENLHTITTYSNKNGKIYAYSIGHKLRQSPPDAGTIRAGKVEDIDGLYELTDRLLQGMCFQGIANTEYKYDSKQGVYKLIEINPRPGLWNYSATAAGVNLPYICYLDVTGQYSFSEPIHTSRAISWYIDFRDFYEAVFKNKKMGYGQFALTRKQWKESLGKNKVKAVYNRADPMPAVSYIADHIKTLIRR